MISQLISIHTTSAKVDYNTVPAKLDYHNQLPECDVQRVKGGLECERVPLKIQMDSTEVRNSIGLKSIVTLSDEFAQQGNADCQQGTSDIVEIGNMLADPNGMSVGDYYMASRSETADVNIDFIPPEHTKVWFEGGDLNMNYTPDTLNLSWDTHRKGEYEYTRGQFNYQVTQEASCTITYLGGPNYVPPSADPTGTGSVLDIKI